MSQRPSLEDDDFIPDFLPPSFVPAGNTHPDDWIRDVEPERLVTWRRRVMPDVDELRPTRRVVNLLSADSMSRRERALRNIFECMRVLRQHTATTYQGRHIDDVIQEGFETLYALTWAAETAPGMIDHDSEYFNLPEQPE